MLSGVLRSRRRLVRRCLVIALLLVFVFDYFQAGRIIKESSVKPKLDSRPGRVLIVALHWNNEQLLRKHWIDPLLVLVGSLGLQNVVVSIHESGSWDGTRKVLEQLEWQLKAITIKTNVTYGQETHKDLIAQAPGPGWIKTARGTEMRRIPYLAQLRNAVLGPLSEPETYGKFDKILFLGDVSDVLSLLATNGGQYAAACSLDFKSPPSFYDTFALRDAEGHEAIQPTWPYFRARQSRAALMRHEPVPVKSCWNGIVVMDAAPFYQDLHFRALADDLAEKHLEASECCLIHADNPLSPKGVFLNPNVRVGYSGPAYNMVHGKPYRTETALAGGGVLPWLSVGEIMWGTWVNRARRWTTVPWVGRRRVSARLAESPAGRSEHDFCVIDETQVLVANGWAHV